MSRQPAKKHMNPDQKPLFERRDVVMLIGVPSPLMLVAEVSAEPEENGEFVITVLFFNSKNEVPDGDYGEGQQYPEGLLQLVKPAAKVVAEAEAATREARAII